MTPRNHRHIGEDFSPLDNALLDSARGNGRQI